jgi:type II secretory pathway component GspD/PulD (secretin)
VKRVVSLLLVLAAFAPAAVSADSPVRYGLDVRDVPIGDAARLLGDSTGYSIVLDGNVPPLRVTLRYTEPTADKAVDVFAQAEGLVENRVGSTIILVRAIDASLRDSAAMITLSLPVHNTDPAAIAGALKAAVPNAVVTPDVRDRLLLVRGTPGDVAVIEKSLAILDGTSAQATRVVTIATKGKASEIARTLDAALTPTNGESVSPNDAAETVTLSGGDGFISRAAQLISGYDRYGVQVEYDVRIAEYTPTNDIKNFGVTFGGVSVGGTPTASTGETTTTFVTKAIAVNATLDALIQKNEAKVIADPTISTINNVPGLLDATEQYPIITSTTSLGTVSQTVQYTPIGVKISMTPSVGADGTITSAIDASYSGILSFQQSYPIIGNRHATTVRRVEDGQTIVIAGLVSSDDEHDVQSVPILSSIPLIGGLFKHLDETHVRSELYFFITPHIVGTRSDGGFPANSIGANAASAAAIPPASEKTK